MAGSARPDRAVAPPPPPTWRLGGGNPHAAPPRGGRARAPLDDALDAAGLQRHVAAVVPTFAVAALLVSSSRYVGLVPQRLAEQYGRTLGIRWFPIPATLPELEVRLLWHARLDADPAQRWLRETIQNTLRAPSVDNPGGSDRSAE
ncbi:LysR substrate-binding domain-containing protein [Nocardia abscessus]|uniref:LysR substrate-binding domain-containing protein n=1 Tax=Nocardia abscessus TaxID=120957 RepID=UPI00245730C4|nr:LysR substrate-binding domain-containing protein [Nocardia abscessus]